MQAQGSTAEAKAGADLAPEEGGKRRDQLGVKLAGRGIVKRERGREGGGSYRRR